MPDMGPKVYETLQRVQPDVGTKVFGTDPLNGGEATVAGYTSGHVDLQVMVGNRIETISIDKNGTILGYASAIREGERAPLALVVSHEVGKDSKGPFIEVQATRDGEPDKSVGPKRRLWYVGPPVK